MAIFLGRGLIILRLQNVKRIIRRAAPTASAAARDASCYHSGNAKSEQVGKLQGRTGSKLKQELFEVSSLLFELIDYF
ncbi:hypothetical protein [Nostoc sp.]|uniref:hypothetical protein n=1 Tax=Nostoc sp. TaxID=1180 RepID=UPI002FF544D8